jgi:hypothetical protein
VRRLHRFLAGARRRCLAGSGASRRRAGRRLGVRACVPGVAWRGAGSRVRCGRGAHASTLATPRLRPRASGREARCLFRPCRPMMAAWLFWSPNLTAKLWDSHLNTAAIQLCASVSEMFVPKCVVIAITSTSEQVTHSDSSASNAQAASASKCWMAPREAMAMAKPFHQR